ncbi:MAG TPA: TAXI family TRAP transporter solute-binding subunit [Bradyrhizobium sp.]|nr:TAXI family TRAP transporter solute-binding subunit [Bradyrhizobium sp.]
MRADIPTPPADRPPDRLQVVKSNRQQVMLYVVLTLLLTVATVWGGRALLKDSETLTFAVGGPGSEEARFATRLAAVLKNTRSKLRLRIVNNADNAKAVAQFERRDADLAVLRTDAKVPPRARSIAILDHDLVLLLSPGNKKIKSFDDLKKQKKIAVWADGDNSTAFIRNIFEFSESGDTASRVQAAPPGSTLDKLFASGFGAVIVVAHATRVMKDKGYTQFARKGGFTLNAIEAAKALARKIPGISAETVEAGILSSSPQIPEEDLDTIGLQWLLVAQSRISTTNAADLARVVYENKAELALDDGFASKIEPAETDKNAFVMAHPGAAEYINDDIKSFMERYSDVMYLGAAALSIIGSIFAAFYAKVTRVCPEKASALATAILTVGEKIEHAHSMDQLEALQDELEKILRGVVVGLRDGTISSDGLETFKLGYEFVRGEIDLRREYLKRHGDEVVAQDDNVAVVKTARSA